MRFLVSIQLDYVNIGFNNLIGMQVMQQDQDTSATAPPHLCIQLLNNLLSFLLIADRYLCKYSSDIEA